MLDAVQAGRISTRQAANQLWSVLSEANFMTQPFGFGDRERRFMHPTPMVIAKSGLWAKREADPVVRQMLLAVGKEAIGRRLKGSRIF